MSTKAQVDKKAKRKLASKQKRAAVNARNTRTDQYLADSSRQGAASKLDLKKANEARLRYSIASKGVIETAKELRNNKVKATEKIEKLTNLEVLKGCHELIPIFGNIHGIIEVATILADMKTLTLTEEDLARIDEYDSAIVRAAENIKVIFEFIEQEQEVDEYMGIYINLIEVAAQIMEFMIPDLLEKTLKPNEPVINQYVREHALEGESNSDFGMRLHGIRIDRVAAKYRTLAPVEDLMPESAGDTALEGELLDEDSYEDLAAAPIN